MGEQSKISWTHHTFNPWIGCTKVSPGCKHCYAEGTAKFRGWAEWGPGKPRKPKAESGWKEPLAWNRKAEAARVFRRVFCASLADVFDDEAPEGGRERLARTIAATPNLIWMLLTKRPERIHSYRPLFRRYGKRIWLGATMENQEWFETRWPILCKEHWAAVRFASMEPLLGPIHIPPQAIAPAVVKNGVHHGTHQLNWIITGGESGFAATVRPMHPEWVRPIRNICQAQAVPFHFKQWGEFWPATGADTPAGEAPPVITDKTRTQLF